MKFRIKENIYDKNNNHIDKKKYKKSKSLNLDVGDVEQTIAIFNQEVGDFSTYGESVSTGEALYILNRTDLNEQARESSFPTYTYSYRGPILRFGKWVGDVKNPVYTTAKNKNQAATILKGKLKKQFGYSYNAKLDIDENKIKLEEPANNEYQIYQNKKKNKTKKDLSDNNFIGSINGIDIYYSDGYYIANDIAFISYDDARDYLED